MERLFRGLKVTDKACRLTVTGGMNRPPMERKPGTVALYKKARRLAAELGLTLDEAATGGGSDGNFTAALGVPTLDGMGAVGKARMLRMSRWWWSIWCSGRRCWRGSSLGFDWGLRA